MPIGVRVEDLKAKKGELIWPKWQRLLEWLRQFRLFAGAGVRLTVTPHGTWINSTSANAWAHPFRVAFSGDEVRVSYGTVNDDVPRIGEIRIDGTDMKHRPVSSGMPFLDIGKDKPKDGRSFIAIQMRLLPRDDDSGRFEDDAEQLSTDADALQIVHLLEEDFKDTREDGAESIGYQPIAVMRWSNGTLVTHHPAVHHNLRHRYKQGGEDRPGDHFFFAV